MPRPKKPRPLRRPHVLGSFRRLLNLEQKELGPLCGCSAETIKSIEIGRLQLSEKLAQKIFLATGVDPQWLLANDLKIDPVRWPDGEPFTIEDFNRAKRKGRKVEEVRRAYGRNMACRQLCRVFSIYIAAEKTGPQEAWALRLRIRDFANELEEDFGLDKSFFDDQAKDFKQAVKVMGLAGPIPPPQALD